MALSIWGRLEVLRAEDFALEETYLLLSKSEHRIGKEALHTDRKRVSTSHIALRRDATSGAVTITDTSQWGTFVGGVKLDFKKPTPLAHGALITLAIAEYSECMFALRFHSSDGKQLESMMSPPKRSLLAQQSTAALLGKPQRSVSSSSFNSTLAPSEGAPSEAGTLSRRSSFGKSMQGLIPLSRGNSFAKVPEGMPPGMPEMPSRGASFAKTETAGKKGPSLPPRAQSFAKTAAAHDEDDDEYDDDDDDWSDNGSRHEGTSPQGIGASLKTIMVRRLSFQKVEPPQEAEAARLVDLETLKHHSGTGSGAGSNDASLVAPDDSVSMAGRSERAMSAARTRHAALPEGARALDSLSAYEVALLLHTLELGRYADGFMAVPVRGADLDAATEHDLEEAGMSVALHRRTLFAQIADFRVDGVSAHYLEQAAADAEAHHHAQQYGYHHAQPHGGGYDDHHHHHHQAHAGQQYGGYDNQYDAAGYGEDAYGYTLDASTQAAYAAQAAAYAAQPQQQPAEEAAEATAPSAADAQSSAAEAAVWAVAEAAVAEEAKQPEPDQLLPMRDELGSPAAPQQTQLAWLKEAEVSSRSPQPSSTELAAAAGEDEFLDSVRPRGFWDNLSFGFKGAFAMQPSAALCACTARRPRGVSEMWLNRDRDGTDAIPTGTSTPKKIITPVITTSPTTNSVC